MTDETRWIYYSAVNSITPQIILNLGFEDNSWDIAVRQLSYKLPSLLFSLVVTWWATRFKDLSKLLIWPMAYFSDHCTQKLLWWLHTAFSSLRQYATQTYVHPGRHHRSSSRFCVESVLPGLLRFSSLRSSLVHLTLSYPLRLVSPSRLAPSAVLSARLSSTRSSTGA